MVSYFELLYHTIMVPGIYQALVSYVVRSVFLRHWQAAHREVQTEDRVMHGLAVITLRVLWNAARRLRQHLQRNTPPDTWYPSLPSSSRGVNTRLTEATNTTMPEAAGTMSARNKCTQQKPHHPTGNIVHHP